MNVLLINLCLIIMLGNSQANDLYSIVSASGSDELRIKARKTYNIWDSNGLNRTFYEV